MSRMDELPPDQRAALSLLLSQRKSYAEVATLLQIPAGAVHDRAQAALAVLAPGEARALSADERAEVGDYLLGQAGIADRLKTRTYLSDSEPARTWALAVAGELSDADAQLAAGDPAADGQQRPPAAATLAPPAAALTRHRPPRRRPRTTAPEPRRARPCRGPPRAPRRARCLGGCLVVAAVVVAVVVAVILLTAAARASTKARHLRPDDGRQHPRADGPPARAALALGRQPLPGRRRGAHRSRQAGLLHRSPQPPREQALLLRGLAVQLAHQRRAAQQSAPGGQAPTAWPAGRCCRQTPANTTTSC